MAFVIFKNNFISYIANTAEVQFDLFVTENKTKFSRKGNGFIFVSEVDITFPRAEMTCG